MNTQTSKLSLVTGRALSGLVVLFLGIDAVMKLVKPAPVVEACAKLGITGGTVTGLGIVLLVCTLLYAVRATSILGAILLTGYLGGAIATHVVRHGPIFSLVFPVILGVLAWVGIGLRDERVRAVLPALPSGRVASDAAQTA